MQKWRRGGEDEEVQSTELQSTELLVHWCRGADMKGLRCRAAQVKRCRRVAE